MFAKTIHLELPRRVTAYYLLFALAAIAWVAGSLVAISHARLSLRDEESGLALVAKVSPRLTSEVSQGDVAKLQRTVSRLAAEHDLAYCAVVSPEGVYLAHSSAVKVGRPAVEASGERVQFGEVERLHVLSDQWQDVREYRTPLRRDANLLATAQFAFTEPSNWSVIWSSAEGAPGAILGPMILMSLGAVVLQRMVRPLSDVERQLRYVSIAHRVVDSPVAPVAARTAAAVGWNRLVEHLASATGHTAKPGGGLDIYRERKADLVLNSLPDGIAVTDGQGKITFANPALIALLGSEAVEYGLSTITMEAWLAIPVGGEPSPLQLAEMRGLPVVVEVPRGETLAAGVLRVARLPLRVNDAAGAGAAGHVWSIRDITQQKMTEQMRNQFVSSATHELRTPLANIKAYAETLVLSDTLDIERQKEFCNIINTEATRLARFIDDLLSLSSIEVGAMALMRQETDMERLLRDVVEKVRPQMTQKRIVLETLLPEKTPKLHVDKDKITATLVNLLGNAAKYTPDGGVVRFRVQQKPDVLQFEVEDTGIGIAADDLPRLFEKFFRSSDPRVREQTGSGLGLSIAQEVVRLHGGKLTVSSELNKGTRFTATLPLV